MFNESESSCSVYLLHNLETDQAYVGSTGNNDYRRQQHLRKLQNGKHPNRKLQNAFNQNPNFEFISVPMENREVAYDFEQALLDDYMRTQGFLNLSSDARAGNHEWSEVSREKMRQAHLGRKHTEETKAKMSVARTGRKHSEEVLEKLRGREVTLEFREKMSNILQGNVRSLGRKHSAESVERRSQLVSRPVSIDGVVYPSHAAVARQLGLTVTTVSNRIKSNNFPGWSQG